MHTYTHGVLHKTENSKVRLGHQVMKYVRDTVFFSFLHDLTANIFEKPSNPLQKDGDM